MTHLEDLQPTAAVRGILPDQVVTVVGVQWFGSEALELTYKTASGRVADELLYRHDESRLETVEHGRPWSFDGEGHLFRLVSEAHRIRLAHLFDPVLAVHTSLVEPLPHQITAVYEAMLPRQPLRFLLADDPGAGKTIMAGLFIKELVARGDLQKCLVACPGRIRCRGQPCACTSSGEVHSGSSPAKVLKLFRPSQPSHRQRYSRGLTSLSLPNGVRITIDWQSLQARN